MAKKKCLKKTRVKDPLAGSSLKAILTLYTKLAELKKDMDQATEGGRRAEERLTNLEIHVNLLARLLTTLCIEKMGIRVGALKRLVHRIENEAVRDSQIMELESLYKSSGIAIKKTLSNPGKSKGDPWEQIS